MRGNVRGKSLLVLQHRTDYSQVDTDSAAVVVDVVDERLKNEREKAFAYTCAAQTTSPVIPHSLE